MKEPPHLRRMGWDLSVAESEYPVPKEDAWQILNGTRKIISISRSGDFFTAGSIEGFLDWGVATPNPDYRLINGFALVEYIDIFFHAFHIARTIFSLEADYIVRFGFYVPSGVKYKFIAPNHLSPSIHGVLGKSLESGKWDIEIVQSDERFPSLVAGEAIVPIYVAGFGITGQYPYLKKESEDQYTVDEELYRRIK